jgi:hypothetical protein
MMLGVKPDEVTAALRPLEVLSRTFRRPADHGVVQVGCRVATPLDLAALATLARASREDSGAAP